MIFQRILKGIAEIGVHDARAALDGGAGITCNWWRNASMGSLPANEVPGRLTEENLLRHLSGYTDYDPEFKTTFGENSPFISTTAGGVERDYYSATNLRFSAFLTAASFATRAFTTHGVIFYGYVNVLGRQAVGLQEFAEETRELNLWTEYQPYHREGEVVAKIEIPSPHLERAQGYDGPTLLSDLQAGRFPSPAWTEWNTLHFVPPESICNIREVL